MQYLRMEHITPGAVLAKAVVGDDGKLLVGAGHKISETVLKRMDNMGFQGAYIDTPGFEDIVIEDVIPDDLRARAFDALYKSDYMTCVSLAKTIAKEMKFKETLKLDLLDIKNDKNYEYRHCISLAVYAVAVGIKCSMNEEQLALVTEGVSYYNTLTEAKKVAVPYFPKGFTNFGDDSVVAGSLSSTQTKSG